MNTVAAQRTEPDERTILSRAYLSRVAEPACVPLWDLVRSVGPVEAAERVRAGDTPPELSTHVAARRLTADAGQDLEAAARRGVRLVVPESDDWPHFALAPLEQTGRARAATFRAGQRARAEYGEPVPPLALWVSGPANLSTLGVRSVGVLGSRAATPYGERVTALLVEGLAGTGFDIVSGGAFGVDAAAHRVALACGASTVLVSAGGLDRPYPTAHRKLFDQIAQTGLLVSESPPGSSPHRHRFLTRNRLIAGLTGGVIVVEASRRSGALNTAGHCRRLGRMVMVVPGPVTSSASAGCHMLLRSGDAQTILVTDARDVVDTIGSASDVTQEASAFSVDQTGMTTTHLLDQLDPVMRRVYDGFPSRHIISVDDLAQVTGLDAATVMRCLPELQLRRLIERRSVGFCLTRTPATRRTRA